MKPIIKIEKVDFFYNQGKPAETQALKNINIEINQGEYVSFLGPSGCGKSTMLYVLSGIDRPTNGKVVIDGYDLVGLDSQQASYFRQIGIGFVFQNFNLIPSLKIVENVALPMVFLGVPFSVRKKRSMELLKRLEIAQMAERYPYELSGGQQQRVGIARALANDPPIILADEPIGNLDTKNAKIVLDILKEINQKEGKTVVIVTHEPWSLRDVTRIFKMRDGEITGIENKKPINADIAQKEAENDYGQQVGIEEHAQSIATLILTGYSEFEINTFKQLVMERVGGNLTQYKFERLLNKAALENGEVWNRSKLKALSEQVANIMQGKKEVAKVDRKLGKKQTSSIKLEVGNIAKLLITETGVRIDSEYLIRLQEVVENRVRGVIGNDDVLKVLTLPKKQNGIGLRMRTGLKIAQKLENLLVATKG